MKAWSPTTCRLLWTFSGSTSASVTFLSVPHLQDTSGRLLRRTASVTERRRNPSPQYNPGPQFEFCRTVMRLCSLLPDLPSLWTRSFVYYTLHIYIEKFQGWDTGYVVAYPFDLQVDIVPLLLCFHPFPLSYFLPPSLPLLLWKAICPAWPCHPLIPLSVHGRLSGISVVNLTLAVKRVPCQV